MTTPEPTAWAHADLPAWEARGRHVEVLGHRVFVVDVPAARPDADDPLVVVHGFPTSAFDFAHLLDHLATRRRVVLVDLLGFGLSDKPDRPYTMALQADVVAAVVDGLGLDRFALLTHDMGDTVGGELLARTLEGSWPVTVTRRVVTNGSIYIQMAQLTPGQLMLLSLPDEKAPSGAGVELLAASLAATLAPANAHLDMSAHAELTCHAEGDALLPRTIRYIEERRANERRFTGAIEEHPAPLHVIWGPEDPIAVAGMAERLVAARPDATLTWIDGAGHFPQTEAPAAWLAAVEAALT
ncbi:MAG: alpha/beta hydrolase [Acidimicrobiales bacterium]|jgi:pimeloyl-ACP methyl ester carboxylesterase|nr:alpha/beta hydrolase [Acidimicrobiales bacterium]